MLVDAAVQQYPYWPIRATGMTFIRLVSFVILASLFPPNSPGQETMPQLVEQTGHSTSVDALAFTPDGRWLISAGHDFSVRLWDLNTGRQVRILGRHSREVNTLAVCPDSSCVVSGANDQVLKLWEIPSGRLVRTFTGHTGSIYCAIFSKDGQQLISGSGDPPHFEGRKPDFSIRIWDVKSGRQLRKLEGHLKTVASVDLDRDGRVLATGSFDGTVKLWDFNTGTVLRTIDGFREEVKAQFSPDGSLLVTASLGRIELWEVLTGRSIGMVARDAKPYVVVFHPTAFQVAYASEGTVKLLDGKNGRKAGSLKSAAKFVESIAYSRDGRWLASGYVEGTIRLWDTATQKKKFSLSGYVSQLDSLSVSPNGLWIASGGRRDSSIKIWSLESGSLAHSLKSENNEVQALAFSHDGLRLAASGEKYSATVEASVEIWEVASGRRISAFNYPTRRVEFVAFSPDGRWLAASGVEGTVKIWDVQTQTEVQTLSPANKAVAFAADGSWVATGSRDNALSFWELPSGRLLRKLPDIEWGYTMSPDRRWLASTGRLTDFKIWDLGSVEESSKSNSDPSVLLSWNTNVHRRVHVCKGHHEFVSDVAFSPDSQAVASGSWDGRVKLWDPRTGREIRTLSGHTSGVVSVAFSPDGKHLYSGAWDGTVRIWDVATGEETASLIAARSSEDWLTVAPDGLFDGTPDAMQQVAWKVNETGKSVALDAFFTDFYHPGLLTEILSGHRPRAQFDIATEIQVPGLRTMLREKLAHLENRTGQVVVCFEQKPGAVINVGPADQRIFFPPVNGYQTGTTPTCKFEKTLPIRDTNSAALMEQLRNWKPAAGSTPWDGKSSDTTHSTLHVLTVGISQYPAGSNFDQLPYAVPSANAIQSFFRGQQARAKKPYAAVRVWDGLYDLDATRENISQRLADMAKQVSEDDVVLLYFAGHGKVSLGEEMFYFIPVDGRDADLRGTGINTAMIADALRRLPARRIMLIVDACQSGGAIEALSKIGVVKAQVEQRRLLHQDKEARHDVGVGVHLIAATLPLSYAVGLKEGESALAATLLEDLHHQQAGTVTANQLSAYIKDRLPAASERLNHGFRQVPLMDSIGLNFAVAVASPEDSAKPMVAVVPPLPGYLTVHSGDDDTTIHVTNVGEFHGDWTDHPCKPGTYVIVASHEGMRTETRTVVVETEKHTTVSFNLSPDPANPLEEPAASANAPRAPVSNETPIIPTAPKTQILASSYLATRDFAHFETTASEALQGGGIVTIDVMHEHLGRTGDSIHPATLTLSSRALIYNPGTSPCKYASFSVPLEKIETIEVTNKSVEGKIIGIVVRHLMPGTFLLHLELRDPAKSNERIKLFLATADSQIVKDANNVNNLSSPNDSSQALDAVAKIIQGAKSQVTWK
jgi:WD40 repeat protein